MRSRLSAVVILLFTFSNMNVTKQDLSGNDIVYRADKVHNANTSISVAEMRVIRPKIKDKIYKMRIYKKGNDKMLARFLSPSKVVGQAFLRNGDHMWLFLPSIYKTMRISPKQLMVGGDFSHGDMLRISLVDDYNAEIIGEENLNGKTCYLLELKAKDRSIAYDRVKYWIQKKSFLPIRQEYYTLSGKLLKILTYTDFQQMGEHFIPMTLIMENTLRKGHKSIMTNIEKEIDIPISDFLFEKQNLERQ